jgi:hypothetical protein
VDAYGCPSDYDELIRNYFDMARRIVARSGIDRNDVDDVTQDILMKFIAKDFLAEYRPRDREYLIEKEYVKPGDKPARFPTFFRSFIKKFLRTPVETNKKAHEREVLRCDAPVDFGTAWIEVYGPVEEVDLTAVEVSDELGRAWRHLATISVHGVVTLADVFAVMVENVRESDKITGKAVGSAFGVSDTEAGEWRRAVETQLREIGFLEVA